MKKFLMGLLIFTIGAPLLFSGFVFYVVILFYSEEAHIIHFKIHDDPRQITMKTMQYKLPPFGEKIDVFFNPYDEQLTNQLPPSKPLIPNSCFTGKLMGSTLPFHHTRSLVFIKYKECNGEEKLIKYIPD